MDLHCIHCSELVEPETITCRACGGDPRARGDVEVTDVAESDPDQDAEEIVAELVAGYGEAPPHERPEWGSNMSTPIELELAPFHIGQSSSADVLPAPVTKRRLRRR